MSQINDQCLGAIISKNVNEACSYKRVLNASP